MSKLPSIEDAESFGPPYLVLLLGELGASRSCLGGILNTDKLWSSDGDMLSRFSVL